MFRLFLRSKLMSGAVPSQAEADGGTKHAERLRNRRIFERFAADHKHLTLMNEQDILLIREISAKGFSTEVAPRTSERLVLGDVYEARVRYLGEVYDLQARVAWKAETFVGFEIVEASRETLVFIRRILRPMEIASSLREVDASFAAGSGLMWLHGDNNSDLHIWRHAESGSLSAWQLLVDQQWIEWRDGEGLSTGTVKTAQTADLLKGGIGQGLTQERDAKVDAERRQLAVDVVMAMPAQLREELLPTLTGQV
jgi:hypothetical protein